MSGRRANSASASSSKRAARSASCSSERARGVEDGHLVEVSLLHGDPRALRTGARGQNGEEPDTGVQPDSERLLDTIVVEPDWPPHVGEHVRIRPHGQRPRGVEPQPLGDEQASRLPPEPLAIAGALPSFRLNQRGQVHVCRTRHVLSLLGVVPLNHRIRSGRLGPLEPVDKPATVRTNLRKLVKRTQSNLRGCRASGEPHLAFVQQARRNARDVNAGELHSKPLALQQLGLWNGPPTPPCDGRPLPAAPCQPPQCPQGWSC